MTPASHEQPCIASITAHDASVQRACVSGTRPSRAAAPRCELPSAETPRAAQRQRQPWHACWLCVLSFCKVHLRLDRLRVRRRALAQHRRSPRTTILRRLLRRRVLVVWTCEPPPAAGRASWKPACKCNYTASRPGLLRLGTAGGADVGANFSSYLVYARSLVARDAVFRITGPTRPGAVLDARNGFQIPPLAPGGGRLRPYVRRFH